MKVRTRRCRITEVVRSASVVPVSQLATEIGCPEMTIRRDLDALEHDGVVCRTRSGVDALERLATDADPEKTAVLAALGLQADRV
jgi:DeoR/GlpR family transcriptional regulator of sugar metabolism